MPKKLEIVDDNKNKEKKTKKVKECAKKSTKKKSTTDVNHFGRWQFHI